MEIEIKCDKLKDKAYQNAQIVKGVRLAHENLHSIDCFTKLGWVDAPTELQKTELPKIKSRAKEIKNCDCVIVLADEEELLTIKTIYNMTSCAKKKEIIFFNGFESSEKVNNILQKHEKDSVHFFAISKTMESESSLECFRIIETFMKKKYKKAEELKTHISVITDYEKGRLNAIATQEKYEIVVYPRTVSGIYSAFSAVCLLPLTVVGVDIESFLNGAKQAHQDCFNFSVETNLAYRVAVANTLFYNKLKYNEIMIVSPNESLAELSNFVWFVVSGHYKNDVKLRKFNVEENLMELNLKLNSKDKFKTVVTLSGKCFDEQSKLDTVNEDLFNGLYKKLNEKASATINFNFKNQSDEECGELLYMLLTADYVNYQLCKK